MAMCASEVTGRAGNSQGMNETNVSPVPAPPAVAAQPAIRAQPWFPFDRAERSRLEFELAVFGAPVRMADDDWPEGVPEVNAVDGGVTDPPEVWPGCDGSDTYAPTGGGSRGANQSPAEVVG